MNILFVFFPFLPYKYFLYLIFFLCNKQMFSYLCTILLLYLIVHISPMWDYWWEFHSIPLLFYCFVPAANWTHPSWSWTWCGRSHWEHWSHWKFSLSWRAEGWEWTSCLTSSEQTPRILRPTKKKSQHSQQTRVDDLEQRSHNWFLSPCGQGFLHVTLAPPSGALILDARVRIYFTPRPLR